MSNNKKQVIMSSKEKLQFELDLLYKSFQTISYSILSVAVIFAMLYQTRPDIIIAAYAAVFLMITALIITAILVIYFSYKLGKVKELELSQVD